LKFYTDYPEKSTTFNWI